ncbi:MAG: S8 family serine peptidase, partial [Planctomycetes bacterium]|nr:S8 family serine peptidase [Planctomycetota bacterium]
SNDDSVTSFTSWGPVDDGRIKPDISGPGCQSDGDTTVTSTSSSGGYTGKCGTSMAAPSITGLSALLLQDYRIQFPARPDFRNSTLKAMLANTAQDIEQVGPDFMTGYGSVRIEPAINLMRAENFVEESVSQGDTYSVIIVVNPGDPTLKVTLAWDDVPGTPNVDPALVNDLDLQVFDPNGVRRFPWTLDPLNPATPAVQSAEDHVNNIEQVQVNSPIAGAWQVDIVGFNIPQGPQPFSIAAAPVLVNCSDAGIARLDRSKYACESEARVTVIDCGLNADDLIVETVSVNVASGTEAAGESLLLTETAAASAVFVSTIGLSTVDAAGVVQVTAGDTVTLTYIDTDDGGGGLNVVVTDNAIVDCTAPVISNVQGAAVGPRDASISFDTDELTFGSVSYGLSCGSLDNSASRGLATAHSFNVSGLTDATTYFFSVAATDEAGNSSADDNSGACYSFTTPDVPDFFSEQFAAGVDLANSSIMFTPNGSFDFYSACVVPIAALPTDPTGGTNVSLSDDGSTSFTPSQPVLLYGAAHATVYINANGNVTFDSADGDYTETFAEHFGEPRIAALWDDINPATGGQISWKALPDGVAVTYLAVPELSTSNSNTFQIEMFYDGRIQISYLDDIQDAITGLSAGNGLDPDFLQTDLSAAGSCGPRPPSAAGQSLQTDQNTPLVITLMASDDGLPDPLAALTYQIVTLPLGQLRDSGDDHLIVAGDLPYTLIASGNQIDYTPGAGFAGADAFQFQANDGGVPPDGGSSTSA